MIIFLITTQQPKEKKFNLQVPVSLLYSLIAKVIVYCDAVVLTDKASATDSSHPSIIY